MKLFLGLSVIAGLVLRANAAKAFNRISSFYVCSQLQEDCNFDNETVAEILDASPDGMMLVYTDGVQQAIGFVDIQDPKNPVPAGMTSVGGEATSVAVSKDGKYALAAVNTSPDFVNPSGVLLVIDMTTKSILATLDLGGQPDSIKVSPDDMYIAIAIENERDEDLNIGVIPQLPAGFLAVVDKSAADPKNWTVSQVVLANLTDSITAPSDPEPELVDINQENIAVVTLQENNGIALVNLTDLTVISIFNAGMVNLSQVDATYDEMISQTENLTGIPREADAVIWITNDIFATADEGDYLGGSRGFTIYNKSGDVIYTSGNSMDHQVAMVGHYPEYRSEKRGNEPEGGTYASFGEENLLFILSERSSLAFVYNIADPANPIAPVYKQVLPTGAGPEGIVAIPGRNLIAVAAEVDDRSNKTRSTIAIYEYQDAEPVYPSVKSDARQDGSPIPFAAFSGLACGNAPGHDAPMNNTVYTIEDSYFRKSRIFKIDTSSYPYTLTNEIRITDPDGILAAVQSDLVNADKTVNLDLEGITVAPSGTLWLASEGAGTVGDEVRPVTKPNLLLHVLATGEIKQVVQLPADINAKQSRFGLEGVAYYDNSLVAAFQRPWGNDTFPQIGIYNITSDAWKFVYYPLENPKSQNGGWVGLSDIAPLGFGKFLVLERDDQGSKDAAIKQYCTIDLGADLDVEAESEIAKTGCKDLIPDLLTMTKGPVYEKVEGLCVTDQGVVWLSSDNDGVENNSGESMLLKMDSITLPEAPDVGEPSLPEDPDVGAPSGSVQWSVCGILFWLPLLSVSTGLW